MGKKKLRKLLEELGETVNRNVTCEKDWRIANQEFAKAHNIAIERIKALEDKMRFALIKAKAPPGKQAQWGFGGEGYMTIPLGVQEKLGFIPIDTEDVKLVDSSNPEP